MWYTPGDGGKDCKILFDGNSSKSNYHGVALQLEHLSRLITLCLEHVHGDTIANDIRDIAAAIAKPIVHIKELDGYLDDERKLMSNKKGKEFVPALPTDKIEYPTPDEVGYGIDTLRPLACTQQHHIAHRSKRISINR